MPYRGKRILLGRQSLLTNLYYATMRTFLIAMSGVLVWALISRLYFFCIFCPAYCPNNSSKNLMDPVSSSTVPVPTQSASLADANKPAAATDTVATLPVRTPEAIPVTESTVSSTDKMVEKGEHFNFVNMTFSENNFHIGSDVLHPVPAFVAYADSLIKYCNSHSGKKVTITGYTDDRGGDAFNQTLGQHRAESIKRYLLDHGLKSPMVVDSKGKREPRVPNDSDANRAKNRRVGIQITDVE